EAQAADTFDPSAYADEVAKRIEAAIQKKVDGQEISMSEAPEGGAQVIDLMEALRASLERKPPARGAAPRSPEAAPAEGRKPPKRAQAAEPAAAPASRKAKPPRLPAMQSYGVRDVERLLGVSRATVRALVDAGFVAPTRGARNSWR